MIFEEVVLHNFGVYRGEHTVKLDVSPEKPIVLIGALNGSGKTTFLDAMQLALYGKNARCSGRERISYSSYLESMINRDSSSQSASVGFSFRARTDGEDTNIRLLRTWQKRGDSIKESFEVLRDGEHDKVASERWSEFVEEFMPSQIADLFFFDGEKIEALADPSQSAALLRVGVHSLLGIDLIENLVRSLQLVERKRKTDHSSLAEKEKLRAIEDQRTDAQASLESLLLKKASFQNEIDTNEKKNRSHLDEFNRLGGNLLAQRLSLQSEKAHFQALKYASEEELRSAASTSLPLMIAPKLVKLLLSKASAEKRAEHSSVLRSEAELRDVEVENFVKSLGITKQALTQLRSFLKEDRGNRYSTPVNSLAISPNVLHQYSSEATAMIAKNTKNILSSLRDVDEHLTAVERNLAAVPAEEEVAIIQNQVELCNNENVRLQAILSVIDEEISRIRVSLERLGFQAEKEAERLGEQLTRDEVSNRIVTHSSKGRNVLTLFRRKLLANNLGRLEASILECFQSLIRKESLVNGVKIDENSFEISVMNRSGQLVQAHRLSAGERQLLAVATLWALARASGRSFPTVIDTPLSRLDSKHRGALIQNYFPTASHQVILLSTDEEVVGNYKKRISPFIGRSYLIEHDESKKTSQFVDGYFSESLGNAR